MPILELTASEDSDRRAESARSRLMLERSHAARLGRSAVEISRAGKYERADGTTVDIGDGVKRAIESKESIPPDEAFSVPDEPRFASTRVWLINDTTLAVARELADEDENTAALNFASGVNPGGGFLKGARAQEETLCRSSALYVTLKGDPMYDAHRKQSAPESSAWIIRSPNVPVFRNDAGEPLDESWRVTFLTCAAPNASRVGSKRSHELLDQRIHRVLELSAARGQSTLVLGAWGCGAFGNDPNGVAPMFKKHLEDFAGCFRTVVFAVTDWSKNRRTFGPFASALARAR